MLSQFTRETKHQIGMALQTNSSTDNNNVSVWANAALRISLHMIVTLLEQLVPLMKRAI